MNAHETNHDAMLKWFNARSLADMSPSTLKRYCIARCADRRTAIKLGRIDERVDPTEAEQAGSYLLLDDPLGALRRDRPQMLDGYWTHVRYILERDLARSTGVKS